MSHVVTMERAVAIRNQQWPLTDVPCTRFADEEKVGIKPVSAVEGVGSAKHIASTMIIKVGTY